MIPIGLNLKNKNVLIVGAGKVALRKAKLFLSQEAIVTIVSPCFLDEFLDLDVTCIVDRYEKKHLENKFLVYACTDNKEVNDQVVSDCNEMNILCGSATRNNQVSFNSMAFEDTKVGMVALSTHQKMPYTKPILNELKETLLKKGTTLEKLSIIREYLVQTKQMDKQLLEKLYQYDEEILNFVCMAITINKGYIFVYHQSNYPQHYDFDLNPSIVLTLKEFEALQDVLGIISYCKVIPLLLSDGFIYQKLKKMTTLEVGQPLITSENDVTKVIGRLQKENTINIWLMHPRSQMTLMDQFKANVPMNDIVCTFEDELHFEENKNYHVVVLLMSEGQHYHELLGKLPEGVSVSKILPLESKIKELLICR